MAAQPVARARQKPEQRPGWPDTIYRASIEAFEMALRYDVDWVVVISGMYFHPDVLELMHRARFRTAVLFTESPYEDDKQAQGRRPCRSVLDDRAHVAQRLHARYLRHAYDPQRHRPAAAASDVPAHDVVFVGTGFAERIELLAGVDWRGIDLGLYGEWSLLGSRHKLRQYVRGTVYQQSVRGRPVSRGQDRAQPVPLEPDVRSQGAAHPARGKHEPARVRARCHAKPFRFLTERAEVAETFR